MEDSDKVLFSSEDVEIIFSFAQMYTEIARKGRLKEQLDDEALPRGIAELVLREFNTKDELLPKEYYEDMAKLCTTDLKRDMAMNLIIMMIQSNLQRYESEPRFTGRDA